MRACIELAIAVPDGAGKGGSVKVALPVVEPLTRSSRLSPPATTTLAVRQVAPHNLIVCDFPARTRSTVVCAAAVSPAAGRT